jgi:hypothetical protein
MIGQDTGIDEWYFNIGILNLKLKKKKKQVEWISLYLYIWFETVKEPIFLINSVEN